MRKLNKKAFTLVELLVAIVILGIVLVIAIPQITSLQKDNEVKKYEKYAESVVTSAKLYTDSYSKDMFGNNSSGCYKIPYADLSGKNLVKDIKINGATCNNSDTFVKVYKSSDNYYYDISIKCDDSEGREVYRKTVADVPPCGPGPDNDGPQIAISEPGDWTTGKDASGNPLKATVTISDPWRLNANIKAEYGWSRSQSDYSAVEFKTKEYTNSREEALESLSFEVDYPVTDSNLNGLFYLIIKRVDIRDQNGNHSDEYTASEAFKLDNTAPNIDRFENSHNGIATRDKVTIKAESSDTHSGVKKVYYTYDSTGATNLKDDWSTVVENTNNGLNVLREWNTEINENVYLIAEDMVGNKSLITDAGKIIIDKTAPAVPTIQMYKWNNNSTAPTSSEGLATYARDSWSNKNIYTIARSSSDNGSEIIEYQYTITGSEGVKNNQNGSSKSITSEGTTTIKYRACDSVGNCSEYTPEYTINIDKTAPTMPTVALVKWADNSTRPSTAGRLTKYTSNTWSDRHIFTQASGSIDNLSSVTYKYTTAGKTTNVTDYSADTRSIEAEGTSTIKYRACDDAGNCSTFTPEYTIKIDKTAPAIPTIKLYKWQNNSTAPTSTTGLTTYTASSWSNKYIYTTASTPADGGSAINKYQYSTTGSIGAITGNNGNTTSIMSEGISTIAYRACDEAGNCSGYSPSLEIKIDKTAPTIPKVTLVKWANNNTMPTTTDSLETYTPGTWSKFKIYTKASGSTDNLSSVVYQYTTTGKTTNATDYSAATRAIEAEGESTIKYRACDSAENCSAYTTEYVAKVDRSAPSIPTVALAKWKDKSTKPTSTAGLETYSPNTWSNRRVFTEASGATDTLSGGVVYQYTTTGSTTNQENYQLQQRNVEASGVSTIKYRACDAVGNCSAYTTEYTVKVDEVAPTAPTAGAIGNVSGSNTTGKIATQASGSTDTHSGVKEYRYAIINSSTAPANTSTLFTTSLNFTRSCGASYYAYAIAIDNAGNISPVKSLGSTSDGANSYSGWSTCSKTCGTGTQTRTNSCALITTNLSRNCNTQSCVTFSCSMASKTIFGEYRNSIAGNSETTWISLNEDYNWCHDQGTYCNASGGYRRVCIHEACKGKTAKELNEQYGCDYAKLWCSCK